MLNLGNTRQSSLVAGRENRLQFATDGFQMVVQFLQIRFEQGTWCALKDH